MSVCLRVSQTKMRKTLKNVGMSEGITDNHEETLKTVGMSEGITDNNEENFEDGWYV